MIDRINEIRKEEYAKKGILHLYEPMQPRAYDSGSGNRLGFIEKRFDGNLLYADMDAGGYVICSPADIDAMPRERKPFTPYEPAK